MNEDRCFCGAAWNDLAEECMAGHPFGEASKLNAEIERLQAEVASLKRMYVDMQRTYRDRFAAENERLRVVVGLVQERVRAAHRDWAPELRNALADLYSSPTDPSESEGDPR